MQLRHWLKANTASFLKGKWNESRGWIYEPRYEATVDEAYKHIDSLNTELQAYLAGAKTPFQLSCVDDWFVWHSPLGQDDSAIKAPKLILHNEEIRPLTQLDILTNTGPGMRKVSEEEKQNLSQQLLNELNKLGSVEAVKINTALDVLSMLRMAPMKLLPNHCLDPYKSVSTLYERVMELFSKNTFLNLRRLPDLLYPNDDFPSSHLGQCFVFSFEDSEQNEYILEFPASKNGQKAICGLHSPDNQFILKFYNLGNFNMLGSNNPITLVFNSKFVNGVDAGMILERYKTSTANYFTDVASAVQKRLKVA